MKTPSDVRRKNGDTFRAVLKRLARQRFGKYEALASRIGCHKSELSQLGNPKYRSGSKPETLLRVLSAFSRADDKERLRKAWLDQYLPEPIVIAAPLPTDSDDAVFEFVAQVPGFVEAGQVRRTARILRTLFMALVQDEVRMEAAFHIGCKLVDCYNLLDRRHEALAVVGYLRELAKKTGEKSQIAEAMWMEGVIRRTIEPTNPEQAAPIFEALSDFMDAWGAALPKSRLMRRQRQRFLRDYTGHAWDMFELGVPGKNRLLPEAADRLEASLDNQDCPEETAVGFHVLARARMVQGEFNCSHEALERARKLADPGARVLIVMLGVTEIRLLIAIGSIDLARKRYHELYDICEERGFFLYQNVLASFRSELFSV